MIPEDGFAWEAICRWPALAIVETSNRGVNFAELTKWHLWDKVGRAIRKTSNPNEFELETRLLDAFPPLFTMLEPSQHPNYSITTTFSQTIQRIRAAIRSSQIRLRKLKDRKPTVFLPHAYWHLERSAEALLKARLATVVTDSSLSGYGGSLKAPKILSSYPAERDFCRELHGGIITGLRSQNVELVQADSDVLFHQIVYLESQLRQIIWEFELIKPDAIFVLGDNHPPYQSYVLSAARDGIPAIMLQHGLDCEHHYLDEAYAPFIAVWGDARKRKYVNDSHYQPVHIEVTGNPNYDNADPRQSLDLQGEHWLWVTRPHSPLKCYAPSRSPFEGVGILRSILEALRESPASKLVIKPHPFDATSLYRPVVQESNCAHRIQFSNDPLEKLLPAAQLVITEDSTAGMDAMLWARPLVFAHFCAAPPTLPMVDFEAALEGFSREALKDSILRARYLSVLERRKMLTGQQSFLDDYAGPRDGNAARRVAAFVNDVMTDR